MIVPEVVARVSWNQCSYDTKQYRYLPEPERCFVFFTFVHAPVQSLNNSESSTIKLSVNEYPIPVLVS